MTKPIPPLMNYCTPLEAFPYLAYVRERKRNYLGVIDNILHITDTIRIYDIDKIQSLPNFVELCEQWYQTDRRVPISVFISQQGKARLFNEALISVDWATVYVIYGPAHFYPTQQPDGKQWGKRRKIKRDTTLEMPNPFDL